MEDMASDLEAWQLNQSGLLEALKEVEDRVESTRVELQTREERIKAREKELEAKESSLKKLEEFEQGKNQLLSLKLLIEEKTQELGRIESLIREMGLKFEGFNLCKKSMEEFWCKVEVKEREVEGLLEKLESNEVLFEPNVKELEIIAGNVKECMNVAEMKVALKFEELKLAAQKVNEFDDEVRLREKQSEQRANELVFKEKQVEMGIEELNAKEKRVNEFLNEVQSKEIHLEKREKDLDSLSFELLRKERDLEQQAKELELKQKKIDFQLPSFLSYEDCIGMDSRTLQLYFSDQLKRNVIARSQMSVVLHVSVDPAKLVLGALRGFYPSNVTVDFGDIEFDMLVVGKTCILLLKKLRRMTAHISDLVREEAMKFAADWKAKLTLATENGLEILCFLHLIATYELTGICDARELQRLLTMIADLVQETNIMPSVNKKNEAESSLAGNTATFPSPCLQPNATRNELGILNENSSGNHPLQKELAVSVPLVPDPAKMVLNNIQKCLAQYLISGDFHESVKFSLLLKEIRSVSLPVGSHLKVDAKKLAAQWKAKMDGSTVKLLESVSFLLFVATYGLVCMLNIEEIVQLLELVSRSKGFLKDFQTDEFCAAKLAEIIQDLIERKQVSEAVRFILIFKLTDKLPPGPILRDYVANTMKCFEVIRFFNISFQEKVKVADNLIGDLRAVQQCIQDHNLESEYKSKAIEISILELETHKKYWKFRMPSPGSFVEQIYQRERT